MIIETKNLTKEFKIKKKKGVFKNDIKVITPVNDVSFNVKKGEIVAFIGPNGAGKSTCIKMMTGIIRPTSGEVKIMGLSPIKDRMKISYNISCMFGQKSQLYMHLSVIDSLKLLGSIYDLDEVKCKERIEYISKLFKIEHLLDLVVRKLSLGQRMICEMAACMLHEPEIIFLDEPTIGLDIIAKLRIREIISTLRKEHNTTIFLTSHDISDVEALCDRVIVINEGKVILDEGMESIKSNYLSEKIITIYYEDEVDFNNFEYEIIDKDKAFIKFKIDTNKDNIGNALEKCTNLGNILDIQIDSTPLEHVIKEIYERKEHHE